jgi:dihydroorotase
MSTSATSTTPSTDNKPERREGYASQNTRLTIRLPDDFHHHVRDGAQTAHILAHATQRFGRCLIMPNTKPPVTTAAAAVQYKAHILQSINASSINISNSDYNDINFEPLMTLYLTEQTTPADVCEAHSAGVVAIKYYPAGSTTNADFGVRDIRACFSVLTELARLNMVLCIHSEVTDGDIFDREALFLERILKPLVKEFPTLKITLEHISTQQAVDYVLKEAPPTVKASITCHHLLYNRNRTFYINDEESSC